MKSDRSEFIKVMMDDLKKLSLNVTTNDLSIFQISLEIDKSTTGKLVKIENESSNENVTVSDAHDIVIFIK